ncbi:sensor histidine kinase [Streptomyces sp. NA04227]|uniref:sensor histidine kinase n=1 Tax=Streptomyces sp. NA04227 TaxID=2742136 RepID=UPI00158FB10F|nr:sensor histidine kinase [Streptomyces sp. NA04227]QKW05615.1 sensor histidine kinase [Streptomyces sp. NA04227]
MVRVETPPAGREIRYLRVLLLPAILMTAVAGAAVVLAPEEAGSAVAACGAVCVLLVLLVAARLVRARYAVSEVRARHAQQIGFLQRRVDAHEEETARLGGELLPEALLRLRQGESPAEVVRCVVDADPVFRELPMAHRALLRDVLEIVDTESALRESSQLAFVNVARRVQAIVHRQAAELREMEEDHGRNPEVFDDLLRIDHGTALIGRLADSVTVLGGARPGRQWPGPVPLFSVLRGAMSRILDYRRVDLHSIADVSILGTSVEPLIHACAELLDNATRYSPPQTRVHVTAVEVQTGIAIEIEDGGVSLSEEARARAERMLAQAQAGIDLDDLGETPRLGLAVVGRLAQMYDMQVSLRQSAYGGVRAVLVVPREMLTTAPAPGLAHGIGASAVPRLNEHGRLVAEPERPAKKRRPTTGPVASPPLTPATLGGHDDPDAPVVTEWRPNGLPQRRSRVRASAAGGFAAHTTTATAPPPRTAPDAATEPEPGLWIEAFMSGAWGPSRPEPGAGADPAAGGTGAAHPYAPGDQEGNDQ